ncbi:MAG: hypothetical protein QOD89_721 [Bradyrhizobium sp.]|jgi:hypothetical protein|nr:hypothetical protein [Bradyrhizobium sp.]
MGKDPQRIRGRAAVKIVIPGCASSAQTRNPDTRHRLWIPGSRQETRPGMTANKNAARDWAAFWMEVQRSLARIYTKIPDFQFL